LRTPRSRVSEKGQVTLPALTRRALGIKPKDEVEFLLEDGRVIVRKVRSALDEIYRSVPALKRPLSDKEMIRIAAEEHAEEVAREGLP